MGLLVYTTFTTPEGFPVSTVYLRIISFSYSFASKMLVIQHECYYDREKRIRGFRPLYTPGISEYYTIESGSIPTMPSLYAFIKTTITDLQFSVEDVLEDGQILPAPAPTTAPEEAPVVE